VSQRSNAIDSSYGNAFFFRLRLPFIEHGERDSQDWQLGVDELATWLASLNDTTFKVSASFT